jgi:deoxyribonuclease-1
MLIFHLLLSLLSISNADEKTELSKTLRELHKPLTYKQANEILFTKLDQQRGEVCSAYTSSKCVSTSSIPSPKLMNVEHTWPQSVGANGEAKSDLHHLFAVDSPTNSIRSSLPFCDAVKILWENGESKRGFSSFNEHCFEPPARHKGNVARALFYFSVRYQMPIDDNQESYLRKWHTADPVDQDEIDRNEKIKSFQNNSNPFIEKPELVDQIKKF